MICDHPRQWRVYRPDLCGYCGAPLPPDPYGYVPDVSEDTAEQTGPFEDDQTAQT